MRRFLVLCGILALAVAGTRSVMAHPHVWVDTQSAFIFDEKGHVRAIKIVWRFDELYSAFAIQGSDADGDGTSSQEELQALADNNVKFLAEWNYFTEITAGLAKAEITEVKNYGVENDDGTLVLWYELPLEFAVDASKASLRFRTYDPGYYVAFDADKEAKVELIGSAPSACQAKATPAGERPENVADSAITAMTADAGWAAAYAPVVSLSCG